MKVSPFAGKPAEPSMLVNVPKLIAAYYAGRPDPAVPEQRSAALGSTTGVLSPSATA